MSRPVIDLTKMIKPEMEIYREGDYSDPPVEIQTWCTVDGQGFQVSKLSLSTQTGTHIDAPAHFVADADTLDAMPVDNLLGRYCLLDISDSDTGRLKAQVSAIYDHEPILFLRADRLFRPIAVSDFRALSSIPCSVWILAGEISVEGEDMYYFNRSLAEKGIFLVEDLDCEAANRVQPGGRIIIMPLRLADVSGSPCRVVVEQADSP